MHHAVHPGSGMHIITAHAKSWAGDGDDGEAYTHCQEQ